LRLYCLGASPNGGAFYSTAGSPAWTEGGVTWNTAPSTTGSRHAYVGPVKAGTWVEVDLSTLVRTSGTYSLRITTSATDRAAYATSEGRAALTPRVVVTLGP
jgi:hypothetical protein